MAAGDTAAADKALCEAIAPILADSDSAVNQWLNAGPDGSPERAAALPRFRSDTRAWTERAQSVLDSHADTQPFMKRTLQRYIDDNDLLSLALRSGAMRPHESAIYSDSLAAYAGPLAICTDLGFKW